MSHPASRTDGKSSVDLYKLQKERRNSSSDKGIIKGVTTMKEHSRGLAIGFVLALCLCGWALYCYAYGVPAPPKSIPPDEANPRLQTVLQELSRTAQSRPAALSELAKDRGIPLQAWSRSSSNRQTEGFLPSTKPGSLPLAAKCRQPRIA